MNLNLSVPENIGSKPKPKIFRYLGFKGHGPEMNRFLTDLKTKINRFIRILIVFKLIFGTAILKNLYLKLFNVR